MVKFFGIDFSTWTPVKNNTFGKTKTERDQQYSRQSKISAYQDLPPSYNLLFDSKDDSKIPCLPSPPHLSPTKLSHQNISMPARPFPKDWRTSIGPPSSSLRSTGYSCVQNENHARRF